MFNTVINTTLNILLPTVPFFVLAAYVTYVRIKQTVPNKSLTLTSSHGMLRQCSRKELQSLAKSKGIKANIKSTDIISQATEGFTW